jgi:hypothetical protein
VADHVAPVALARAAADILDAEIIRLARREAWHRHVAHLRADRAVPADKKTRDNAKCISFFVNSRKLQNISALYFEILAKPFITMLAQSKLK